MVFFYLVTTGWIFDTISLCENSINQSISTVILVHDCAPLRHKCPKILRSACNRECYQVDFRQSDHLLCPLKNSEQQSLAISSDAVRIQLCYPTTGIGLTRLDYQPEPTVDILPDEPGGSAIKSVDHVGSRFDAKGSFTAARVTI